MALPKFPHQNCNRLQQKPGYAGHPASIHLLKSETRSAGHGSSGGIDPPDTELYTLCALAGTHIQAGSSRSTPPGFIHSMSPSLKSGRISVAKLRAREPPCDESESIPKTPAKALSTLKSPNPLPNNNIRMSSQLPPTCYPKNKDGLEK